MHHVLTSHLQLNRRRRLERLAAHPHTAVATRQRITVALARPEAMLQAD